MRRILIGLVGLGILGGIIFYVLTIPSIIEASALPNHTPDIKNGEYMFYAGGCASCHAAPASAKCDDQKSGDPLQLTGGRCLPTPFGKFYVPNISSDKEHGIGGWTQAQFVTAMVKGVSPNGSHYYPAFPYTSYQLMKYEDLMDLKAFIDTLPAVKNKAPDHELALPFKLRRGLGLWKFLFLDGKQFTPDPKQSAQINRGAYLTDGPGHCSECHSPRNILGGIKTSAKYSGGPSPEGEGYIPNITPHEKGIGKWSAAEIVEMLRTGYTPSFDMIGGTMAKVQANMAKLTREDQEAMAAYLKSLPAYPGTKGK